MQLLSRILQIVRALTHLSLESRPTFPSNLGVSLASSAVAMDLGRIANRNKFSPVLVINSCPQEIFFNPIFGVSGSLVRSISIPTALRTPLSFGSYGTALVCLCTPPRTPTSVRVSLLHNLAKKYPGPRLAPIIGNNGPRSLSKRTRRGLLDHTRSGIE